MADSKPLDTPSHWRLRAEMTRSIAEGMFGPEAKRILNDIAADYERMALDLERASDPSPRTIARRRM